MKDTLKLSIVLSLYTVVACLALAFVHNFTEPIIQKVKEQKSKEALQSIFPLATSFEDILGELENVDGNIKIQSAFVAKKEDEDIGMTIQATGPTYAHATILVGITMDRKITSIKFLELLDTPSLGSKAAEEPFIGQFNNKSIQDNFSVGDDVVAISGATITSKGVATILKTALSLIDDYMNSRGGKAE